MPPLRRAGRWAASAGALALWLCAAPAWGAYPGENGRIAFTRAVDSFTSAIFSMEPDGGDVKRLTFAGGFNGEPSWSPDGTKIAFASNRDGDFDIWVMNADGSDQRRVQNHPETDTSPTWSPDGTLIAFDTDRESPAAGGLINEIYVTTLDGQERPVTRLGGFAGYPAWAPDNSEIAYYISTPTNARLSATPPGGGATRSITTPTMDPPRYHFQPDWSPDSSRLAFWSESGDLLSVSRGGGRLLPLIVSADRDFEPAFSPDGLRMAFRRQVSDENGEIFVSDASGSNPRRITFDDAYDSEPDWQHKPPPAPPPPGPGPGNPPTGPGTPVPPTPTGPTCAVAPEILGNRADEDCDGVPEGYPVVGATLNLTGQRVKERRRVNLLALRVLGLQGGETVSMSCRGRCSSKLALRRKVKGRTRQLALDGAVAGDWVATSATLLIRIARDGYASKISAFRMRQGGATPWVVRRTCELPGGAADADCDGFRDLPVLRARARLAVTTGKRATRLRQLRLSRLAGGESVALACRGGGCRPALTSTATVPAGTKALRLDRQVAGARLRAGARLELTISRADAVARVFRWTFRANRAPILRQLCQEPGAGRAGRCPGA